MKFLRKKNDEIYRLGSMQARIFAKSAQDHIPSYFFIQSFMNSEDSKSLDDLSFLLSGSSELEIYQNVSSKVKRRNGIVYPEEIMHWIGFFYRYASYLTNIDSSKLFKNISPQYLNKIYPAYHGVDIEKAIEMVFKDINYKEETPLEKMMKLYKSGKLIL